LPLRLLLIEDSEDDALLLVRELRKAGFDPDFARVDTPQELEAALVGSTWDAVIADYNMPAFTGLDALRIIQAKGLDLPFILVSGVIGEEKAVEAMKAGAHDYIMKGNFPRLALERELRDAEVRRERRQAEKDLHRAHDELEMRVQKRTAELERANEVLRSEVSERKRVEEALRESRQESQFLGNIIELSSQPFGVGYQDGRFGIVNAAFEQLTGFTADELRSLDWAESLTPPEWREIEFAKLDELLSTGRPVRYEKEYIRKDGSRVPVELLVHLTTNAAGKPEYFHAFVTDITERKQTEQKLLRAKEAAEAANRAKSQFLANMSHELRTPMTGVLGMLDLVQEGPLNTQQRENIEMAQKSGRSLLRIIKDVLDLTKIESGKLSLEEAPFILRECVAGAIDIIVPEARRRGLDLISTMADDLPKNVVGDRVRLQQVITNLCGNAVKFTDKGKVEVRVVAGGLKPDGRREITLSVSDTGIGIPKDKRDAIFHSFSQADDSDTRQYGGTGLGLAISREIAERMGGAITFESEEGVGSTFSVTIPLYEAEKECEAVAVPAEPPPASSIAPLTSEEDRPRLLIAEDDAINRAILGQVFRLKKFVPEFAANGREAVKKWENGSYDLVIMDIQMPLMDGLEATRTIREKERTTDGHVIIVAMTAHAFSEDRERCLAAGMDAYLTKPLDFNQCFELIASLLGKKSISTK